MGQGGTPSGFRSRTKGFGGSTSSSTIKTTSVCRQLNGFLGTINREQMKKFSNLKWGYIPLWMITFSSVALAHEIIVHQRITANAAASAFTYSPAYRDFLNTVSLDCDLANATNYLIEGSAMEDAKDKDHGGKRSYNHFYD